MPLELKVDSSKIIRMRKSIRHMWDKISSLVLRLVCTSIIYHSINAVYILQFSGVLLESEKNILFWSYICLTNQKVLDQYQLFERTSPI